MELIVQSSMKVKTPLVNSISCLQNAFIKQTFSYWKFPLWAWKKIKVSSLKQPILCKLPCPSAKNSYKSIQSGRTSHAPDKTVNLVNSVPGISKFPFSAHFFPPGGFAILSMKGSSPLSPTTSYNDRTPSGHWPGRMNWSEGLLSLLVTEETFSSN